MLYNHFTLPVYPKNAWLQDEYFIIGKPPDQLPTDGDRDEQRIWDKAWKYSEAGNLSTTSS